MRTFSDKDFVEFVNDKTGNIVFFRRKLKDYEMLSNRQQLTIEHANIFKEIKELKQQRSLSWADAMDSVIPRYASQSSPSHENVEEEITVLSLLHEINRSLKNIEGLLRERQN